VLTNTQRVDLAKTADSDANNTTPTCYKKSHANAKVNAQQRCMFESPVKQNQSPEGARRPAAIYI